MSSAPCPFCSPEPERVFYRDPLVLGLWDAFPVAPGHALLITMRHVPSWFDASAQERVALLQAIEAARDAIQAKFSADGYNIGVNSGAAAGQTVPHLHVHVIPRRHGDVADPRGGVRYVLPHRGNYLDQQVQDAAPLPYGAPSATAYRSTLIKGGTEDPLLPGDGGVDLVLTKDGRKYFVQCKHWRAQSVGVTVVRELNGVMAAGNAAGGFVVTSGSFTQEARVFASSCAIDLLDGQQLAAMIRQPGASMPASVTASCPKCGSAMIRRVAKKGAYAGREFWGCSRYPACRGTVPI